MLMPRIVLAKHVVSTRCTYFAAGFGVATWAPLVPYVKNQLSIRVDVFGLLLLCLGLGSIASMPVTGALAARFGCARVIRTAGTFAVVLMPLLPHAVNPVLTALVLFSFGAAIGTVDVAMNIQAVEVEKRTGRSLMSGFHGFFSLGGIAGATFVSWLIYVGISPRSAALFASALVGAVLLHARRGWLERMHSRDALQPFFATPRGPVILLCSLCLSIGIVEGAAIDWSAIYLVEARGAAHSVSGLGYAAFAAAMTVNRFLGEAIINRFGPFKVLWLGAGIATIGFLVVVLGPSVAYSVIGFAIVGVGASNMVPIICSLAGRQSVTPASHAIAAVTSSGYAGIMVGPALLGAIIQQTGLEITFAVLAALTLLISIAARIFVVKGDWEKGRAF